MKKTIAKIMAAAMVLSTVVAPNVNAATDAAVVAGGGVIPVTSLGLSQEANTLAGNLNSRSLLGSSVATIGSRNNPNDVGIVKANYNNGLITSVETDAYVTGTSRLLDGDLLYFNGNTVYVNTGNAVTQASVDDFTNSSDKKTEGSGSASSVGLDVDKLADITGDSYTSARDAINKISTGTGKISNINAIVDEDELKSISNSVLKETVSNGIFKADQYIGADVFDRYTIAANGQLIFWVDNTDSTKTAQIQAAMDSSAPIVMQIRIGFTNVIAANGDAIADKNVWIRLASQNAADYDGFVILHQDNGVDRHIGVDYSIDGSGYATITRANTTVLKSDAVKGGRLYLDYVYNRTNTDASTTSALAYKIRTIGSRVFKDGKFQAISGRGDDGAKWIRNIHNGAFRSCKQLKKVNLDTSKKIRKINAKAFYDCKKLATVKMDGRNLKTVGSNAFKNTKSNITFKIKGNASQFKKAKAKIAKQAPKKAKFSRI